MDEVKKCGVCHYVFDFPRNGDLYFIRGEEIPVCNGCADRISETRRFTGQFENAVLFKTFLRSLGRRKSPQ